MLEMNEVKKQAMKELHDENMKSATASIKRKLKEIDTAKKIVANLERELDELYVELGKGLS